MWFAKCLWAHADPKAPCEVAAHVTRVMENGGAGGPTEPTGTATTGTAAMPSMEGDLQATLEEMDVAIQGFNDSRCQLQHQ